MSKVNLWCPYKEPHSACTPYMAPEQLCRVCHAVYSEVMMAVKAEKDRILRELPGVFGQARI